MKVYLIVTNCDIQSMTSKKPNQEGFAWAYKPDRFSSIMQNGSICEGCRLNFRYHT